MVLWEAMFLFCTGCDLEAVLNDITLWTRCLSVGVRLGEKKAVVDAHRLDMREMPRRRYITR